MYRTHNCGELRISHKNKTVVLSGWVQKLRDKGGMVWIDLRDRYGVTQLIFEEGIFTGGSADPTLLRILPPLSVGTEEIDFFIDALKSVLKSINHSVKSN